MKQTKLIIFAVFLIVLCTGIQNEASSQNCTCNQPRLADIMDNADVKIVASYGSNTAVSSISPGTTYYLRVQATSGICEKVGSGCNGINAPTSFCIKFADGCTVFDDYVPPTKCLDVGTANNFTAYFRIKTHSGGDFLDQLYFRIGVTCFPDPNCELLYSNGTSDATHLLP